MNSIKYLIIASLLFVACGYQRYSVTETPYSSPKHVENQAGAATSTLVLLGYEIEKANWKTVETKVERLYIGKGKYSIEFQTWITVDIMTGNIKAYCTQRKRYDRFGKEAPWRFDKCTSPPILHRVNTAVENVAKHLETSI